MLLDLADLASETSDEIYPDLPQIAPWWIPNGSRPGLSSIGSSSGGCRSGALVEPWPGPGPQAPRGQDDLDPA